uniref:Uncharacterized protein n=1 Tax=Branchiostoma floridae TaxID=7739 RepID=C3Y880_BRAFL|eukprot:XP_002607539.1 hypothetical protein BRAFLDRAFT_106487 [Branchiostoma floridae]
MQQLQRKAEMQQLQRKAEMQQLQRKAEIQQLQRNIPSRTNKLNHATKLWPPSSAKKHTQFAWPKSAVQNKETYKEMPHGKVTKEPQDGKVTKEPRNGKVTKEPQDGKVTKEPRNGKVTKEPQNGKMTKEPRNGKVTKEPRNGKVTKEPRNGKVTKEPRNGKVTKEPRNGKVTKEPQDGKVTKETQDGKMTKEPQDGKVTKEPQDGEESMDLNLDLDLATQDPATSNHGASGRGIRHPCDETTSDGSKVCNFQANTAKFKTQTMGCVEVPGGESAEQLKALGFVLKKVAIPTSPPDGTDKKTKKLLAQGQLKEHIQSVHAVLDTLLKIKVKLEDLPGEKFSQTIRLEANLAASIHVEVALSLLKAGTLYSDETSSDGSKVCNFQANTAKFKTQTMGCVEVPSGESAEQLKALGFVLKKVAMPTSPPDGTDKKTKKLLAQAIHHTEYEEEDADLDKDEIAKAISAALVLLGNASFSMSLQRSPLSICI